MTFSFAKTIFSENFYSKDRLMKRTLRNFQKNNKVGTVTAFILHSNVILSGQVIKNLGVVCRFDRAAGLIDVKFVLLPLKRL